MISHVSISPLDAVLVLGIFGFVALCCAALVLEERDAFDLKWGWLAAFSLGRIAGDLLGLMGLTMEVGLWTRPLRELFLVISLLCLVEFGRTGREMSFRWTPGPWIHPLLLGVVALAYAWGWAGMDLAARVILGTVGALWSARALGSREGEGAGWLRIAAAMLLLMTVVMVVSGLATVYLPVELFRDVGGGALMFTPLKIVHAGAVLGLAGAMWGVLVARQDVLPGTPSWRDFFRTPWPVAGLVLALGGGCLLARSAGILADRDIRRELLERTRGLAAAIETEQVASLRGEVGDDKRRGNQLLFRRLAAMAEAQPDIHCTFLVKEKAGRLIFLASARARRLKWRNDLLPRPGSLFLRHGEDLTRLMKEGAERVVGPSDDSRGRWLSPLVPIRDRDRGEVVALLGQDYDASRWEREVARSRLPFLMAGLFVAIGLVGAQAFRFQQERSANRLATSEMRFSQLFDQMLNGFALHELVRDGRGEPWDFRYIEINPSFERLTGLKREDVIGRTLREALPGIEPRWIETYLRVVATGVPELIEHFATPLGRWYRATAYCPSPGQLATVFSDATERIRTQRLLRGIAEASHILLAEEDLHRAIRLAMERLGRAADVHRAYWFERHPHPVTGEPCVSQRCEWSAEGIAPQVDSPDLQNMLVSGPVFRRWEAAFVRRMPIQGLVRDSPSPEREVLQSQGVISIVGIPILIGKEYAGFIGFDECRREREW
jgi:PAS domain-containing protein